MTIEEALELLKENGYKFTEKRKDILDFFDEEDGYRTASDLLERMDKKHRGISFDTIYRNLHLFSDLNILETTELNGEKHFRLSCGHEDHHHHFICQKCGSTKAVKTCPMKQLKQSFEGYLIKNHKFEIYGLCPSCH